MSTSSQGSTGSDFRATGDAPKGLIVELTKSERNALVDRADLLESAARWKSERRLTWAGLLRDLGDYGSTGGSAADTRCIIQAMVKIEAS